MDDGAQVTKRAKRRLTLMRSAKTSANAKHGMGGLPKGGCHKPKPVTLPRMPWDDDTTITPTERERKRHRRGQRNPDL